MIAVNLGRHIGNQLYKFAFPIYRPLYSTFKRYADRTERGLLRRHLPPGSVAVDAGANIGIYSEFLSHCVGPTGRIHSFEPDPHNFARLHAALSETPNVRLNKLALSDRTGESTLYVSDDLNVDHRAYPTEGEPRREVAIRSVRLDGYFHPGERVDLLKLDIQGFELHALRGSEQILRENPKIKLLFEFWPYGLKQAGASGEDLVSHLRDRGFELFKTSSDGLTPLRPSLVQEHPRLLSQYLRVSLGWSRAGLCPAPGTIRTKPPASRTRCHRGSIVCRAVNTLRLSAFGTASAVARPLVTTVAKLRARAALRSRSLPFSPSTKACAIRRSAPSCRLPAFEK